jgi:hypothetical protein
MTKRLKAYEYETFYKARRYGYTLKQYENSVRGKKRWDSLSTLKKEIILDNLREGRARKKFKLKFEKLENKKEQIEVYEIVSQSHYDARGKTPKGIPYKTLFEYTTKGYFEHEPDLNKIEKMVKNSLISAFNNGRTGRKGYLKKSAFDTLVENNLRGLKIVKTLIPKEEALNLNKMEAELTIKNNRYTWRGRN